VSDQELATTTDAIEPRRVPPALIAVAVLLALLGAYLLLVLPVLGGGDTQAADEPATVLAASAEEAPETDGDPVVEEVVEDPPLVTYEVFLSRDPFDPVVPEPVEVVVVADDGTPTDGTATGGTDGSVTPGDPNAPGPVDPVDGSTPTGDEATPPPTGGTPPPVAGCTTGDTVSCDGRLVGLVEVRGTGGDAVAIIQVDTTLYEVRAGETFAGAFQLTSVSGSCANVLYGDDAFQICEGDRTLK
jgi:hypothetical protein